MFGKFEEYITCGAMRCSVNLVVFVCGAVQHADTVQHADAFFVIRAISSRDVSCQRYWLEQTRLMFKHYYLKNDQPRHETL